MTKTEELYRIFLQHPEITTDSRNCPDGSVFFALKGDTFDGNAYAKAALSQGCSYAVVDEPRYCDGSDLRLLLVDDALTALQQLARHHRRQLRIPIIGITGTNGKTTTKELVAAVLSRKYNVLYTQGNFNNHIGVPKTLLRITPQHDIAVIEMGANHPGEIKTLVNIAEPDFGLITNVGRAHLQGFGSFEGVIRTKGELYDYLRGTSGKVFINENNPYLEGISSGLDLIRYGNNGRLLGCTPYLSFEYNKRAVSTRLVGAYNLDNALAAACIGNYFGVSDDDIRSAIADYEPSNNRSQLVKTAANTLIVDAYNANPTSMKAALDNFRMMEGNAKMVILGDMKELGDVSLEEHTSIIRLVGECQIPAAWFVGEEFTKAAALIPGQTARYRFFDSVETVRQTIGAERPTGKTILIKGSNSTRLFTLPALL